ncbi:MAG: hypothetical protein Q9180_000988 [Flavoplaca navasiana]
MEGFREQGESAYRPIPPSNKASTGCSAQDLLPDLDVCIVAVGIGVTLDCEIGKERRDPCSNNVSYKNAQEGDLRA